MHCASRTKRRPSLVCGILFVLALLASTALADPGKANPPGNPNPNGNAYGINGKDAGSAAHAPELDPGLLASALTLLAGGLMIFRDRKRQR